MRVGVALSIVAVLLASVPDARAGLAELALVTGADAGGGPHVRGWNALGGSLPVSFHAFSGNNGGVRVATADVTGDGRPEIVAAPGASGSEVKVFDGRTVRARPPVRPVLLVGIGCLRQRRRRRRRRQGRARRRDGSRLLHLGALLLGLAVTRARGLLSLRQCRPGGCAGRPCGLHR